MMRVFYRLSSLIGRIRTSFSILKRSKVGNQKSGTQLGNSQRKKLNSEKSMAKYFKKYIHRFLGYQR